jgi:FAD-linked oxidoreductase
MGVAMQRWSNWSGSVVAQPRRVVAPRSEDELSTLIMQAQKVRAVGAGHSFTPLCATDDTLISLQDMDVGGVTVALDRRSASVPAGWSLKRLTEVLWALDLSLSNQGDVNPQAVAGAIATGTHGAGAAFGSLSTFVRAARLIGHDGRVVMCSRSQQLEVFEAARLSLGALGVMTRVDISVEPAFYLEERLESVRFEEAKAAYFSWAQTNRHVEFFVFPYGKHAIVKTLNPTDAKADPGRETDMGEGMFRTVCDVCARAPFLTAPLQAMLVPAKMKATRTGPAYRIYPSTRTVRFEEMEYAVPLDAAFPALEAVIAMIKETRAPVTFPFEVRLVAGDDIWLSPFNRGPAVAISMHQYAKMAWRDIFRAAEAIFRDHGGRPHWGKRHSLTHADAEALYPRFGDFCRVRGNLDPLGKFVNPHLAALLECAPSAVAEHLE